MSMNESGSTMVEALRRANPVPEAQTADRRSRPSAHALLAEIIAEPPRRVSRRLRRRVLVVAIAIVLIALLLAAFVVVRRDRTNPSVAVVCYAAADRNAPHIVTPAVGDPRASCARLFENGTFADLGITRLPPHGFDVCVNPKGTPEVFPGESGSVCKRLGLPEAAPDDGKVEGFLVAIDRRVSASCMPQDPAVRIIESEEHKRGLSGWTIKLGDRKYDAAHPCTSMTANINTRVLTLVPYPGAHTPPPTSSP